MENISLRKRKNGIRCLLKLSSEKISSTVCQGLLKEQKQILMFVKFDVEKISATACQALEKKEQNKNSDVYQTECRKGNADDYHAIEKAKSKRPEKIENSEFLL